MHTITHWIERAAARRWPLGLALIGQLASFRILRVIGARFRAVSGEHEAFDFQNGLTVAAMQHQLLAYTPRSKRLYRQFFIADFWFPLLASTFLSLAWATLLQHPSRWGRQLRRWHTPLWPFVPTLCDWGENICFLIVIERYPHGLGGVARLGVGCKRLKLLSLAATFAGSSALVLATILDWTWHRLHR